MLVIVGLISTMKSVKKSSSNFGEIELEQVRMLQRLEEHNKKGVVSYQEYETAKTAIAERFARQRLELAGKYAPEKLLKANRDDELKSIQELYEKGQINQSEAAKASNRVQFDYAQQMSKVRSIHWHNFALSSIRIRRSKTNVRVI